MEDNFQKLKKGYKRTIKGINDTVDTIMVALFKIIGGILVVAVLIIVWIFLGAIMNSCDMLHPDP